MSDTLALLEALIARPSVTPLDEGCQEQMTRRLAACGFTIEPMRIEDVDNFWASHGDQEGPVLCFAGHTDVVPTGPVHNWQHQPFDALIDEVRALLKGIDADEYDSQDGWWSTSTGTEFGAAKLAALESLLRERLA